MAAQKMHSAKKKRMINNVIVHVSLAVLAAIWVFPIVWVILTSFRAEKGSYVSTFFPKEFTLDNYIRLFTDTSILNFPKMFMNTLIIAVFSCILATFYTLAVSYCLSRLKFKLRKPYMNMAMNTWIVPGIYVDDRGIFYPESNRSDGGKSDPCGVNLMLFRRRGTGLPDRKGIFRHDSVCGR